MSYFPFFIFFAVNCFACLCLGAHLGPNIKAASITSSHVWDVADPGPVVTVPGYADVMMSPHFSVCTLRNLLIGTLFLREDLPK